mgnify:CR=1 FL=1
MGKIKKESITLIIMGIVGAILTYLFYDTIWRLFVTFIGLIIIVWGLAELLYYLNAKNYKLERIGLSLLKGVCLLTIGILTIIPWTSSIIQLLVSLCVGLYILINCIMRLIKENDKLMIIKKDIFKYIISLLIIGLGINGVGKYIVLGLFILCIVCGIIQIINSCRSPIKKVNKIKVEKTDLKYEVKDTEE